MSEFNKEQQEAMETVAQETMNRIVPTQLDTMSTVGQARNVGAFAGDGIPVINYVKNNDKWNNWSTSIPVLQHETKHNDNEDRGLYAYAMSREQLYKVNMHDEISANLASLVYLRDQYLKTGDVSIFEREDGGRFAFYGEAIKNGVIEPNSDDPEKFAKEMSLMVNGTQKMWMECFSESYVKQNIDIASDYYNDFEGKYTQFYDENYNNALKSCYTIGGIDFTQYMKEDVQIPETGMDWVRLERCSDDWSYENLSEFSNAELAQKYDIPAYQPGMSLDEYKQLLEHNLVVNDFMDKVDKSDYIADAEQISDLLSNTQFQNDYNEALNEQNCDSNTWLATIMAFRTAARECYEKDGKFPESDGVTYNQALNQKYTFEVTDSEGNESQVNLLSSLNADGRLPMHNPSQVRSDCDKVSSIIEDHNGGLWHNVVSWANDTAEKVGEWWDKPLDEKVSGLKNKFLGLFKKEEEATEMVSNDIVNPVVHSEPREWQPVDGQRYSPIIEREILDLRQDVIRKPVPVMIMQPEGYDSWLSQNSLIKIMEELPDFNSYIKQLGAVNQAEVISSDNASLEELTAGNDVKSQIRKDAELAYQAYNYQKATLQQGPMAINEQTSAQQNSHPAVRTNNFVMQQARSAGR